MALVVLNLQVVPLNTRDTVIARRAITLLTRWIAVVTIASVVRVLSYTAQINAFVIIKVEVWIAG